MEGWKREEGGRERGRGREREREVQIKKKERRKGRREGEGSRCAEIYSPSPIHSQAGPVAMTTALSNFSHTHTHTHTHTDPLA